jgi:hypothetical protein
LDATLPKGKHYLKIVATKGGFNINWIDIVIKHIVTNIENVEDIKIQVYPNPANDKLFISCLGLEYTKIEIFDMAGKNLFFSKNRYAEQSINLNLPDGTYLLVLSNSNQSFRQKFVIKK